MKTYKDEMTPLKSLSSYYLEQGFNEGEARRLAIIKSFLKRELHSGKFLKLADLGCGAGFFILMIAKKFNGKLTGVDITNKYFEELKALLKIKNIENVDFIQSDIRETQFPDKNFDIITCSEVLEHLDRPEEAVLEIKRILKDGGSGIVSVPFEEEIKYETCIHCNKKTPHSRHLHSFTKEKIESLLRGCSFKIISSKPVYSVLPIKFYNYLPQFFWSPLDIFFQKLIGKKPRWLIVKIGKVI